MKTTAQKTYTAYNQVLSYKGKVRDFNIIVLVRHGDFYETYEEDADQVTGICGIGQYNRKGCLLNITAFGVEYLDTNLPKIIRAGHRVAIIAFPD